MSYTYEFIAVQAFPGVEQFNISAVLSGECLNSSGSYVNSSFDLGTRIENSNGNLIVSNPSRIVTPELTLHSGILSK